MIIFKKFLKEIEKGLIEKKILGTLPALIPNHMFREECCYLTKLSMVSDIPKPVCGPREPRILF